MDQPLEGIIASICEHLPLGIEHATFEDTVNLTFGGPDWSLNVSSPSRLVRRGQLLRGSDDIDSPVADLLGRSIIRVEVQSRSVLDPAFELDDGRMLEVFSCDPFEPWVLRLPDGAVWVRLPS